jgi:phosphate transport system permease protein
MGQRARDGSVGGTAHGAGTVALDLTARARWGDQLFSRADPVLGAVVIALVVGVAVFLLAQALPALAKNEAGFLTDRVWELNDLSAPRFGIPDLLWVTVVSSAVAMALAMPLAIGVALFLTQYAPRSCDTPSPVWWTCWPRYRP